MTTLLELLAQGERNVEDLARAAGLRVRNVSQHLQQVRLVTSRKAGLHVYYRLTGDDVVLLMQCVRGVAKCSTCARRRNITGRGPPS